MKKLGLASAAIAVAVGIVGLVSPHAYAAQQTCVWTGTAGDNKFSTATNWSGCNSVAPQTGDSISLGYTVNTNIQNGSLVTLTNDLPSTTKLGGLVVDSKKAGTTANEMTGYQIDKLAFGDGASIVYKSGDNIAITDTVTSTGSIAFDGTTWGIFHPTAKDITLTPTNLTIQNVPMVCMGGPSQFSTYIKPTGQVTVGAGTWYNITGTESSVVVASTGGVSLSAGTYAGNITFNGGGTNQAKDCSGASASSLSTHQDVTLSGTITLAGGDILYNVGSGSTLTITGTINGSGSALKAFSGSTGTFVNNAKINNSSTATGSQTVPMQTLPAVTDSQPTATLIVQSNTTVSFDGVRQDGTVYDKGVLMGGGSFSASLYVSALGTVAPGHSPGCLTSDTLSLYGTYQFELGGTTPCTGYDQLIVKNAANVAGAVTLDSTSSVLATSRYKSYTPKQGQVFVIINQAGAAAVQGTFKDLAEGSVFTQNGVQFKISYKGGDGNDVTLTVMNKPTAPNTGFALLQANPLMTGIAAVVAAGALLVIGRKLQTARR